MVSERQLESVGGCAALGSKIILDSENVHSLGNPCGS